MLDFVNQLPTLVKAGAPFNIDTLIDFMFKKRRPTGLHPLTVEFRTTMGRQRIHIEMGPTF